MSDFGVNGYNQSANTDKINQIDDEKSEQNKAALQSSVDEVYGFKDDIDADYQSLFDKWNDFNTQLREYSDDNLRMSKEVADTYGGEWVDKYQQKLDTREGLKVIESCYGSLFRSAKSVKESVGFAANDVERLQKAALADGIVTDAELYQIQSKQEKVEDKMTSFANTVQESIEIAQQRANAAKADKYVPEKKSEDKFQTRKQMEDDGWKRKGIVDGIKNYGDGNAFAKSNGTSKKESSDWGSVLDHLGGLSAATRWKKSEINKYGR